MMSYGEAIFKGVLARRGRAREEDGMDKEPPGTSSPSSGDASLLQG